MLAALIRPSAGWLLEHEARLRRLLRAALAFALLRK